jgi:dTDP-4-dehydrorhamnose reductase
VSSRARLLVIGGDGMLGWEISRTFNSQIPSAEISSLGRSQLDLTQPKQMRTLIEGLRPTVVVNAAAYTKVDQAEKEKEKAMAVNAEGPKHLGEICARIGARLIHFSTDQVFDGKGQTPWKETDVPRPSNFYAETKWLGEKAVLEVPKSLVLRVQWLYGQKKDRFTPLKTKTTFSPFSDQYGSPAWTRRVAEVVLELLKKENTGLFHFAYDDFASWAEVYVFVKEVLSLNLTLEPKKTSQMNLPANRPLYSVMSNEKLLKCLGWPSMGSWRHDLKKFLSGHY